jgi:hypothetical protein
MLGDFEKTMIEQIRDALKEAISQFPLDECMKSVASNADILKMRAQMEKLRCGLTPGEPLYEFCAVIIAYCDEHMTMTRLLEGPIRGMNGAQKKLLRQIDDILEEDKENG